MENETDKKSDIVSHQQAWGIILGLSYDNGDNKRFEIMNRYIAQQEARDNHLEEAAELLRRALSAAERSNLLPEPVGWHDRDQAISATTAAPSNPSANRGEFINPQNASEAHVRAVEALESGKITQSVAWLCNAVQFLVHEPKT